MQIIIEGADGSGKSTFAKLLSEKFGFPIVHRDKPKNEQEKKQMFDMYLSEAKKGSNAIYDRYMYSEQVYGPIMRDASFINIEQMYEVEVELAKTGAIVIFCDHKITTLWEACLDRGETYIKDIGTLYDIQSAYRMLFFDLNHLIPILQYRRQI